MCGWLLKSNSVPFSTSMSAESLEIRCPPVTRTYLMWDPDQPLDTAALFEPWKSLCPCGECQIAWFNMFRRWASGNERNDLPLTVWKMVSGHWVFALAARNASQINSQIIRRNPSFCFCSSMATFIKQVEVGILFFLSFESTSIRGRMEQWQWEMDGHPVADASGLLCVGCLTRLIEIDAAYLEVRSEWCFSIAVMLGLSTETALCQPASLWICGFMTVWVMWRAWPGL